MNNPAHPRPTTVPGYWADAYGWATTQASLIRDGKLDKVDWEHLAEEIEGMARNEYRALQSALRVLLLHLLKWDVQPNFRCRSWLLSIAEQHRRFTRGLQDNPSLKQHLETIRTDAFEAERKLAAIETGLDIATFPDEAPGWNLINNPPVREEDILDR